MTAIDVSVVIPSFNHERFVGEAIASALEGGGAEREVVVIDDGSTDGSRAVLARWALDPRVRVELQENRGAHVALDLGIGMARGDIVLILNSDDLFAPERISRVREELARRPEVGVVCSWLRVVDASGTTLGIKEAFRSLPPWPARHRRGTLRETGAPELALLEENFVATTSNLAFRRSWWSERGLGFAPLRYTHDWDLLLAAATLAPLAVIEEPLVAYRVHGQNTIGEGRGGGAGEGAMRFEIAWTIARHAVALRRRWAGGRFGDAELKRRTWRSLPPFVPPELFAQLLLVRSTSPVTPRAYWSLLDSGHPFRQAAERALAEC